VSDADFAAWAAQWRPGAASLPPAPIVPVGALNVPSLRGMRVIIGLPGHGWRGDLRADNVLTQGAHSVVPILVESEWYRAELEQIEVFASLVPAERVWVETHGDLAGQPTSAAWQPDPTLTTLDVPPIRISRNAREVPFLTGRRVSVTSIDGVERDLRAVTEPYSAGSDRVEVRVAREGEWYRWAANGKIPATRAIDVTEVWVE
jgi:hypothetical protein